MRKKNKDVTEQSNVDDEDDDDKYMKAYLKTHYVNMLK